MPLPAEVEIRSSWLRSTAATGHPRRTSYRHRQPHVAEIAESPARRWHGARAGNGMSKIDEARDILEQLGLPPAQQNDIACLTLLALTGLSEGRHRGARLPSLPARFTRCLVFMRDTHEQGVRGEHERKRFRRKVIHQLEQARVVDRNPDAPDLPTNSPRTHYGLTDEALKSAPALRDQRLGRPSCSAFRFSPRRSAWRLYQRNVDGCERYRSGRLTGAGDSPVTRARHNKLQAQVVNGIRTEVRTRSHPVVSGRRCQQALARRQGESWTELGVPITEHDKIPDVVLYDEERNWLFLVEAVTSHGPVTPKRFRELEATLENCTAARVYVSAFPDFRQFKRHAEDIVWETEVWIAEIPDHLIHFNGDKFLGAQR